MTGICTPDFKSCYSYQDLSGKAVTVTFALAPKAEYTLAVAVTCVVPVPACDDYRPVASFSYYYAVEVTFVSGAPNILPVTAKAINTDPSTAAFQGLTYKLDAFPSNSSGRLVANISVNPSLSKASFDVYVWGRVGTEDFVKKLLYKTTGCGGSKPVACSSGDLVSTDVFSTVRTGIGTPINPVPYLLAVRDLSLKGTVYFVVWIPMLTA
jgi:hypothetical protein